MPRRGARVLSIPPDLDYVEIVPFSRAAGHPMAFIRAAAATAHGTPTHALMLRDGSVIVYAATTTESDIMALLATVKAGAHDASYWYERLQGTSVLLPQLDAALALGSRELAEGLTAPGSPHRTALSIAVSAHARLDLFPAVIAGGKLKGQIILAPGLHTIVRACGGGADNSENRKQRWMQAAPRGGQCLAHERCTCLSPPRSCV